MTHYTKILTPSVIGANNVNTGANVKPATCSQHTPEVTNEITIYREEDWFKVFIHEAIHSFRLDFPENGQELKKLFPINSDINLFEAYTEFWAEIINIMYCCLDKSFSKTMKKMDEMLQIEIRFSLFQAVKVLNHMNLNYENILEPNFLYREESNVFAYFILKLFLIYNYNSFILCCKQNKKLLNYDQDVKTLIEFIKLRHKTDRFLRDMDYMEQLNVNDTQLLKTMKMTLFELK